MTILRPRIGTGQLADNPGENIIHLHAGEVDFARLISASKTEYELFHVCGRVGVHYGLPHFSVMRLPTDEDVDLSQVGLVSNWPGFMVAEYDQNKLLQDSPIIAHLLTSTEPLVFDIREINKVRPEGQRGLATELFQRNGIFNGVFFSVHLPDGRLGAVSFTGNSAGVTDAQILELSYLSNLIFSRVHFLRSENDSPEFDLKERELECLVWASKGKTSGDIALILDLSEHTVNHYLANVQRKLDAMNRVHAVSKAFRLGLIR